MTANVQRAVLLVATIQIFGCATTANYEAALNSWVGVNADQLVSKWGAPQNSSPLSNGGRVLEYDKQRSFQTGGYTYTSPVTTYNSGNVNVYGSGGGSAYGNYTSSSTTYVEKQTQIQTWNMKCATRFTVDASNIIRSWAWEGNDCKALAPPPESRTLPREPGKYSN